MKRALYTILAVLVITLIGIIFLSQYSNKHIANSVDKTSSIPVAESVQFNGRFSEGSTINGFLVADLTEDAAEDIIERTFLTAEISVFDEEGKLYESIPVSSLKTDFSSFKSYLKDKALHSFNSSVDEREYVFDLLSCIDINASDLSFLNIVKSYQAPENARLEVNVKEGIVELVDSKKEVGIPEEILKDLLTIALREGQMDVVVNDADLYHAAVLSDNSELLAKKATLDTILNKTISISVCKIPLKIKPAKIREFLTYDGNLHLDEEKIIAYVNELKSKYDTRDVTKEFLTSTGETVLITKGTYGWSINVDKTVERIKEAVLSSDAKPSISCYYTYKGQRPANDELAGFYIEVSIDNQHVWMYRDGQLIVDDDCCTGDITVSGKKTRTGMYFLKYKKRDTVLKGSDYADFVNYWMPYDKNIGMHDATWRTDEEFGGTNYIGNGSHGCVNLRLPTAEIIYNNWEADVPIIVW